MSEETEKTPVPVTGNLAREISTRIRNLFAAKPDIKGKLLVKISSLRMQFQAIDQALKDQEEVQVAKYGGFIHPQTMQPAISDPAQGALFLSEQAEVFRGYFTKEGLPVENAHEAMDFNEVKEKYAFTEEELSKGDLPAHFVDFLVSKGLYILPEKF